MSVEIIKPYEDLIFIHLKSLKKSLHKDRQIRDKQKLFLNLFVICINELVFPKHGFNMFAYKMLNVIAYILWYLLLDFYNINKAHTLRSEVCANIRNLL